MSDLNEQAAGLANKLNTMIDYAFTQGAEHMPDVVNSLIAYKTITHSISLVFGLGFLIVSIWLLKMAFIESKREFLAQRGLIVCGGGIIGAIGFFSSCVIVYSDIASLLMLKIAPKVYLIEYAAALIK